ncbi:MAG: hypothetical protein DRO52_04435 [Candidatus Hecatellales archaeon]|nr:MAG: hypothetical protein DRO52_04435 [Candidatus Hecatellales archaeon]
MIVVRPKPLEEILEFLHGRRNILIVGCDGCTTPPRGLREAQTYANLLELAGKLKGENFNLKATTIPKTCDSRIAYSSLVGQLEGVEAIVSLACGIGVQVLNEVFPEVQTYPGNDTVFNGMEVREGGIFEERCMACGSCLLGETGGICPVTMCAKGLLNGPCGGFFDGKCEVGGWVNDCGWVKIFDRLKQLGRLDLFTKIRLPKDYRDMQNPRRLSLEEAATKKAIPPLIDEVKEPGKRPAYSQLMKKIRNGEFVVTGEVEPVKTTDLSEVLKAAETLKEYVTAINVTDNPTAFAYMNALIPSYYIQEKVGVEAVYQMVARDRNRLALTSDLLAAGALGIKNILALSGDTTTMGDNPQSKRVWDLDVTQFIYMISKIVDEGVDLAGNEIHNPPKFNIGSSANPCATPLEPEIYKLVRKQNAGAEFLQTNSLYDIEIIKHFLDECRAAGLKIPILIGITPFKSVKMMDWLVKYVPGVVVPDEIQEKLRKAREKSKEAFVEMNIEIFSELCREIRKTTRAAGIHMMAIGFEWVVPKILEGAGLK